MKLKIVVVGAGSREFGPATICDILLSDPVNQLPLEICLMDLKEDALIEHKKYAEYVAETLGRKPEITYTTSLEKSLEGADYVITAIEIARYHYWSMDFHIPRKYGFNQIYGENGGPGGLFHALRNFTPSMQIIKAMESICPDAVLFNYTNPLTKLCEVLTKNSKQKLIGLCHGVFQGKKQLCKLLEIEMADLDAKASGLNHFTWFESIREKGTAKDLYPILKKKEREGNWLAEWDEIALSRTLLRLFDLYPSPGTNHVGEYIRWSSEFLGSQALQYYYDPMDGDPWAARKTPTFIYNLDSHPTDIALYENLTKEAIYPDHEDKEQKKIMPSGELAIPIIEGLSCGMDIDLPAINIPNNGLLIPGLPEDAVVEVPATVNKDGLHPQKMKKLPEAVLAMLRIQCSINQLLVEAYNEKSRKKLLHAVLLDPTCHSYRAAVQMIDEMCARQESVLPELHW